MTKQLSCSIDFMRGLLLLLNIIFVLVGIALIGLGIYIKVDNNFSAVLNKLTTVSTFEGQSLGYFAFVLIGGGVFTLLISFAGCLGSIWHNRCLLIIYTIILGILMILEIVGISLAFGYKSKLKNVYKDSLTTVFTSALTNNDMKVLSAFHELEGSMKCCAVNGINDYGKQGKDAPHECYQYPKGCSDAIIESLDKNLPIIGGTLGTVLLFELLAFILSIILTIALKNAPDVIHSSDAAEVIGYVVPGRRRNYTKVT